MGQFDVEAALRRHLAIPLGAGPPLQHQIDPLPKGPFLQKVRFQLNLQFHKNRALDWIVTIGLNDLLWRFSLVQLHHATSFPLSGYRA